MGINRHVDGQLELRGLHHWQVRRLFALEVHGGDLQIFPAPTRLLAALVALPEFRGAGLPVVTLLPSMRPISLKPWRKAFVSADGSGDPWCRNPTTGIAAPCGPQYCS